MLSGGTHLLSCSRLFKARYGWVGNNKPNRANRNRLALFFVERILNWEGLRRVDLRRANLHRAREIFMHDCLICERIELIRQGENPYFVRELETGYVVIGDHQRFYGYTLFLCKQHATELHFLKKDFRAKFLEEMSLVAEAVYGAFEPDKLNYELLGAGRGLHMHWHFFPRRAGDTPSPGPVWRLEPEEMHNDKYLPSPEELSRLVRTLDAELARLLEQ